MILEYFGGLISGHQFYSEDQEARYYEKYIRRGRHTSYVPSRNESQFENINSYQSAFERISELHSHPSIEHWTCHIYARKLYDLFC